MRCVVWLLSFPLVSPAETSFHSVSDNLMPRVYLNHFFVVLDPATFEAVKNSPFMKDEFAAFEQRITTSQNQTWSGLYFYGIETYFEFLPVGSLEGQSPGDCSIAFGVDGLGDGEMLLKRLNDGSRVHLDSSVVYRDYLDGRIPWFHLLLPKRTVPVPWFETWLMEYHKDFLRTWYPSLPPSTNSVSRRAILERYRAKVAGDKPRVPKLFQNVVYIEIALPPSDLALFTNWLSLIGYQGAKSGKVMIYSGPEVQIAIRPSTKHKKGALQARFTLSRPLERTVRFGKHSVLRPLKGNFAVWSFE